MNSNSPSTGADPAKALKELAPSKDFFVGIDSDGCVFDSMEIKHKECFCPQFVNHYGLQAVSKYAREAWEFVNLYSKTRGVNRFLAVTRSLDLLNNRQEIKTRVGSVTILQGVRDWAQRETKLGNPALKAELERNPNADLKLAYAWSLEVNETIAKIVHNVPPFPLVRECLTKITETADAIVVSQTPFEALQREWDEHNLSSFARTIAGQEMGTKTEHLGYVAKGRYDPEKILMIGDAPGDLKAGRANGTLFFPVNPGAEEESWKRLYDEGLGRFFQGTYAGDYEKSLIEEFDKHLPELPPWEA